MARCVGLSAFLACFLIEIYAISINVAEEGFTSKVYRRTQEHSDETEVLGHKITVCLMSVKNDESHVILARTAPHV